LSQLLNVVVLYGSVAESASRNERVVLEQVRVVGRVLERLD
jgi:hypothetical protein